MSDAALDPREETEEVSPPPVVDFTVFFKGGHSETYGRSHVFVADNYSHVFVESEDGSVQRVFNMDSIAGYETILR